MKKIFGLTVAALLVMGLVGGGTWAYFTDVETSESNLFTAGTLDLNVATGDDPVTLYDSIIDVKPGDADSASCLLENVGTLEGELDIAFVDLLNNENGQNEPEALADVTAAADTGELGAKAWMAIWLDYDNLGDWSDNDVGLKSTTDTTYSFAAATTGTATGGSITTVEDSVAGWTVDAYKGYPVTVSAGLSGTVTGTAVVISNTTTALTVATPFSAAITDEEYSIATGPHYDLINSYEDVSWNAAVGAMTSAHDYDFVVEWVVPGSTVGNEIQSDGVGFGIEFTLEQSAED